MSTTKTTYIILFEPVGYLSSARRRQEQIDAHCWALVK